MASISTVERWVGVALLGGLMRAGCGNCAVPVGHPSDHHALNRIIPAQDGKDAKIEEVDEFSLDDLNEL